MKIAITCPASLPATQFGGILFLGIDLARELSKKGNEVVIYTTDLDFSNNAFTFNRDLPRLEKINGFAIRRSHVIFRIKLFFVNPTIYNQIKRDKPNIIHSIGIRSFQALVSALISKFNNIPLIISDQGGLFTHPDYGKAGLKSILYRLQEPMIKFIIKQAKKIIVANEYEHTIFSRYCKNSKLVLVRNGVDFKYLQTTSFDFKSKHKINGKMLLFLGRFNKVKGIDLLLQSFSEICKRPKYDDVTLVIMGADFGYQEQMFREIKRLKLGNRIKVVQNPSREEVIAAYHSCEFAVLPSRWEMSPLTPLEVFSCKKPVISTNVHGIPYVVKDGKNGILVQPENSKALTNAITTLLDDNGMRVKFGNNAFSLVKDECNSKIMTEKIFEIYTSVIN